MSGHQSDSSDALLESVSGTHGTCRPQGRAPGHGRNWDAGHARASGGLPLALVATALLAAPAVAAEDAAPSPQEDTASDPAPVEAKAADAKAAPAPERGTALKDTIGDLLARTHGSASLEYRLRRTGDDTDQDLRSWLDLRVGDGRHDALSAAFFVRSTLDLDRRRTGRDGYEFTSLPDTFDSDLNARLYTAYVAWRPEKGPAESVRFGRQYVYGSETFHIDGVSAASRELWQKAHLRASVYGGVPVHLYESSPRGDWLAGTTLTAEPARGTRAALDYVHVTDDFGDRVRDDTAAVRVWQRATPWLDLYGRGTYLGTARDAELRATGHWDEQDLLVQASWFRLFESYDEEFTTEFDPYYTVLHTLAGYDQGRLRAVKGFGDKVVVEGGLDVRDVRDSGDEGAFNRDTHRWYLTPSVEDLVWEDSVVSLVVERWSGDGERFDTYGGELTHRFSKRVEASLGTDYALYGYDAYRDRERNHVRAVHADLRWKLTDTLTLRLRHSHERDDEETYDVFTLGLTLDF